MIKTLEEIKVAIQEDKVVDEVFTSIDGKSTFRVDETGKIVDIQVTDFDAQFEYGGLSFEEYETKIKKEMDGFVKEHLPQGSEVDELSFEDLVELLNDKHSVKFEPSIQFDSSKVRGMQKRLYNELNSHFIVENEIKYSLYPQVLANELKDFDNKGEIRVEIESIINDNLDSHDLQEILYMTDDLVRLVKVAK